MLKPILARPLATLVCGAMLAGPMPALARDTIRCDSPRYGYRYCRADTDNRVELERQYSSVRCERDRSWGYDRHGVWVDHGCSAEFRLGRDSGGGHKTAAVGAAVVGLALLAAMASSNNKPAETEVSSWAVGTFNAYDEFEKVDVEVTLVPGGAVNGRAGSTEFTGSVAGNRLTAGRHVFAIERSGNGFIAVDEKNANHRLQFKRSGGGY